MCVHSSPWQQKISDKKSKTFSDDKIRLYFYLYFLLKLRIHRIQLYSPCINVHIFQALEFFGDNKLNIFPVLFKYFIILNTQKSNMRRKWEIIIRHIISLVFLVQYISIGL